MTDADRVAAALLALLATRAQPEATGLSAWRQARLAALMPARRVPR